MYYAFYNNDIVIIHELVSRAQTLVEVKEMRMSHASWNQSPEPRRHKSNRPARPQQKEKSYNSSRALKTFQLLKILGLHTFDNKHIVVIERHY